MRAIILASGLVSAALLAALPARAQTLGLAEVKTHVGQQVTVEAAVSDVHTVRSGMTFIDMGGRYPDNAFVAVIFADDAAKFPNVSALEGKTVDISGPVQLYRGKPEIILKSADQLKAK
jgi:DNA/RNA endonuclease YhcR with UshA esterase domain